MPLDRNKQYFRDVDAQGNLIRSRGTDASAGSVFDTVVLEERMKPVSFHVTAHATNEWDGQKWLEKNIRKEIEIIEKEAWERALKRVLTSGRSEIGCFPDKKYHLHTLENKKGKTYAVELDCRELIENHQVSGLERMREEKNKLLKPYEDRKNLRAAAVLSAIHLLLNLTTMLSCLPGWRWLYPFDGLRVIWALLVAGIMLVAVVRHLSKTVQPLFGLLMALFTFCYQCAGPNMQGTVGEMLHGYANKLEPSKAMLAFGIMLAIPSFFFFVLYAVHAGRAKIPRQDWGSWISSVDAQAETMHRELCFLKLWYKHMTGKECPNLKEQEDALLECAALADRHRR